MPESHTLREWEAIAAARKYPPLPKRTRLANWLVNLVFCSACLLPRVVPLHWMFCRQQR
jgi:hypothetical protein